MFIYRRQDLGTTHVDTFPEDPTSVGLASIFPIYSEFPVLTGLAITSGVNTLSVTFDITGDLASPGLYRTLYNDIQVSGQPSITYSGATFGVGFNADEVDGLRWNIVTSFSQDRYAYNLGTLFRKVPRALSFAETSGNTVTYGFTSTPNKGAIWSKVQTILALSPRFLAENVPTTAEKYIILNKAIALLTDAKYSNWSHMVSAGFTANTFGKYYLGDALCPAYKIGSTIFRTFANGWIEVDDVGKIDDIVRIYINQRPESHSYKEYPVSYKFDARLSKQFIKRHSVGAYLVKPGLEVCSIDTQLSKTFIAVHNVDTSFVLRHQLTYKLDSVISESSKLNTSLDTILVSANSVIHNVDTVNSKTMSVSTNVDSRTTKTFTGVFNVVAGTLGKGTVAHSILTSLEAPGKRVHSIDSLNYTTLEYSHNTDSLNFARKSTVHGVSARLTDNYPTYSIDTRIAKELSNVQGIDARLKSENYVEYLADTRLLETFAVAHSTESIIKEEAVLNHNIVSELQLILETKSLSHSISAIMGVTESPTGYKSMMPKEARLYDEISDYHLDMWAVADYWTIDAESEYNDTVNKDLLVSGLRGRNSDILIGTNLYYTDWPQARWAAEYTSGLNTYGATHYPTLSGATSTSTAYQTYWENSINDSNLDFYIVSETGTSLPAAHINWLLANNQSRQIIFETSRTDFPHTHLMIKDITLATAESIIQDGETYLWTDDFGIAGYLGIGYSEYPISILEGYRPALPTGFNSMHYDARPYELLTKATVSGIVTNTDYWRTTLDSSFKEEYSIIKSEALSYNPSINFGAELYHTNWPEAEWAAEHTSGLNTYGAIMYPTMSGVTDPEDSAYNTMWNYTLNNVALDFYIIPDVSETQREWIYNNYVDKQLIFRGSYQTYGHLMVSGITLSQAQNLVNNGNYIWVDDLNIAAYLEQGFSEYGIRL